MIETVLVGTDGSPQSKIAVEYATMLVSQLGAAAVLVHAAGLLEQLPSDSSSSSVKNENERLLKTDWAKPFLERGLQPKWVVEDGPPLLVLPRIAERERAELIVVGSHGHGNPAALPLGSTAHGLREISTVPVLVVPVRDWRPRP